MPTPRLFSTDWVHAYEEDTAAGAVYRPSGSALPLSRRPREHLKLAADGTATVTTPGADDRGAAEPARWHDEDGTLVVRARSGGVTLRIVEQSADRLIVQTVRKG
jgi:hypothetical protein